MTRSYLRFFLIVVAIAASSACYIYGYQNTPKGSVYTGIRSLNASDFNQHLSFIDECRKGNFFIRNRFTSEPHQGFMVRPVYFLLSIPFRFISLSNSAVFHIIRIFCGILLLVILFPLLHCFELEKKTEIFAFVLLVFTSGVGIVTKHWLPQTVDLNVPESILFLSLGEAPHFIFSALFLWTGLTFLYLIIARNDSRFLIGYFLCLTVLWWEHPFDAVIMISVSLASIFLLPGMKLKIILVTVIGILSLPPFIYYQKLKSLPAFAGWASNQNLMTSPPLVAVLSGIFPLLLIAIPGFVALQQDSKKRKMMLFLLIWCVTQLVLLYLPFPFQRRLIAGIQFPFAVLAAYGLKRFSNFVAVLILVVCMSTNFYITAQFINELRSQAMPFYLPEYYKKAFNWLGLQKDDGAVLSEFVTGNFIPAYSGHPSFMGHSSFTPNILKRREQAVLFYNHPDENFLRRNNIQYVFWGIEEKKKIGGKFSLEWPIRYNADNITIYGRP
jgi:hypothetical protein